MPGWIWVILAVFMLVMIVAGGIFAFLKAKGAFSGLGELNARVQKDLSAIGEKEDLRSPSAPAVTHPLARTAERYADIHAATLDRKAARRARHTEHWSRWEKFNTETKSEVLSTVGTSAIDNEGGNR